MIETNIIEWLDFGDSTQTIDIYSRKRLIIIFRFFRLLTKNKYFPRIINIILIIIFFFQIWIISITFMSNKDDNVLEILDYLKNVIILFEAITPSNYIEILITTFSIIFIDFILMILVLLLNKKINLIFLVFLINFLNTIIYYYFIGPALFFCLSTIWCENNIHKFLKVKCYSHYIHLIFCTISFSILLFYLIISYLYSFFCNQIGLLKTSLKDNLIRINCNYEIFCLTSKISMFCFCFLFKQKINISFFNILFQSYIYIICLTMSIYTYRNLYYYNNIINILNHFGWYFSTWFSFCVLFKSILSLKNISVIIITGWLVIILVFYKNYKINEKLLLTELNYFEFTNINLIEAYIDKLLKYLSDKENIKSKILFLGIIKKFENYLIYKPELYYSYHKLLNDKNLLKKYNKKDDLPILSIIYIIYSFYLEKLVNKEEITFHMCYFLINKLDNPVYAMFLCSKLKIKRFKNLYYKYLLTEDIKEYLILLLNKNSNKESFKQMEIGKIILYYLYIDLFKINIYDSICYQIDYFDLLKTNFNKSNITENFLKCGENILKTRNKIRNIWEKINILNPFNDECYNDYMLYLNTIIQDEILSKEETKNYIVLKNIKFEEKDNIYHRMFLIDTSAVILLNGYLSNKKVIYTTKNFSFLFMFNSKELSSLTIDDLLPNIIKTIHKDLIDESIKYSNINYIFKEPRDTLLKNNNDKLFNIKLFVKSIPNLSYGLIFFNYLQKIHQQSLIIILDKDLKINGFTEIPKTGTSFTISNNYNLNNEIIGFHIAVIIPEILFLIEYKNEEYNIIKKDYELRGHLYSIDKIKQISNNIDIILDIIKNSQGPIDDISQNISHEFNQLKKELDNQKCKSFSIFYRIKLYTFLEGKYKYYRVYINNNIMSGNEYNSSLLKNNEISEDNENKLKFGSSIKSKENEKNIKIESIIKKNSLKNENGISNNIEDINNKSINISHNQKKLNENEEYIKENNKEEKTKLFQINYKSNIYMIAVNKIKNNIINKKEIFPIIVMRIFFLLFSIIIILFMFFDYEKRKKSFKRLSIFLENNLYFNQTKIDISVLYSISVDIRWMEDSLYIQEYKCPSYNCSRFYYVGFSQNLRYLISHKNSTFYLGEDFKDILDKKYFVELSIYNKNETENYVYTFDNFLIFLINNGYFILDKFLYYTNVTSCKEIPEELGIDEINLQNFIEQSYNLYNLDIGGYTGEEKTKKINEIFDSFPILLLISIIIIILVFSFNIYYIIYLHNIELYFLEKLINFNSANFDNYIKNLVELKNQLRNDDNDEEGKEEDDNEFQFFESKKNNIQINKINEKDKKKNKDKYNKIYRQKKFKLKIMLSFFKINNIFFGIKIALIMLLPLTYYIISYLVKLKFKDIYIDFDSKNTGIEKVFKDSYDIFISIKRELDLYERNLFNCTTLRNFYQMNIPNINDLQFQKLEDLIIKILEDTDLNVQTLYDFDLILNENICKDTSTNQEVLNDCSKFWSGILTKGMRQAIVYMGIIIGNVLDEMQAINEIKNNKTLLALISKSSFFEYQIFCEYYLSNVYIKIKNIFKSFRREKLDSIFKMLKLILSIYIIISIILFIIQVYFIYSFKNLVNSFLDFIGILPLKYLTEDEDLYNEIIKFGNNFI